MRPRGGSEGDGCQFHSKGHKEAEEKDKQRRQEEGDALKPSTYNLVNNFSLSTQLNRRTISEDRDKAPLKASRCRAE